MASVTFAERMSGKFYFLDEPLKELPIAFDFEAHVRGKTFSSSRTSAPRAPRGLGRLRFAPQASVTGRIRAEGFADSPVQGTIDAAAFADRRIPYDVFFLGNDGKRYRLRGEKDLSWLAPFETLVVLPFTIGRAGDVWTEVARGTMRTHADPSSIRAMVRSLRASPF
jgi:hypothetical protein